MRIYFDENFSPSLIKGMMAIQNSRSSEDVTVCSVVDEFGRGAADETWIPSISKKHGVALTQDLNIHRTRAQLELCLENKIGVFFLKPPKAGWNYWQIVQLVVRHWPEIVHTAKTEKRPFGYVIEMNKAKLSKV